MRSIAAPEGTLTVRFNPDGRTLASGGGDDAVHLWDVATGREVQVIAGHTAEVRRLEWSQDGARLATASDDATARIVVIRAPNDVTVLHHDAHVNYVALDPASDTVVTVGADGHVPFSDPHAPASPRSNRELRPEGRTGDGRGPSRSGRLRSSRRATARLVQQPQHGDRMGSRPDPRLRGAELRGHRGEITDSAWSPDGTFALTGSIDGTARLWDARAGKQVTTFDLGLQQIWSVAYSRDGRHVATGTKDGIVLIWELPIAAR